MSPAPRRHRAYELARKLAHLLVVVVGWVGFVWLWLLVAARPWDSQGLTWLILGSLVLMPLLTGAWVLHNRSIHRRKGDRQAVSPVDMGYAHDWHGRIVQADWDVLRRSRSVIVEVKGDHKHYLVGHTEQPGPQTLTPARTSGSRHVAMQDSPLE